jgi:hypothetical protein
MPIDPFDVLFPWMAFADDLFIAGVLLKLLHKYGGLPDDVKTTPLQLLTNIKASIKAAKATARASDQL